MKDIVKKRLLITGVSGLLGNNLAYCLKNTYDILGLYNAHGVEIEGIKTRKIELTSETAVEKIIEEFDPDIIIHCAAISDVDFCEDHQDLAQQVNVSGTRFLVNQALKNGAKFVYISTDLLYGDSPKNPLPEDFPVHPTNYYALTKYQGEREAARVPEALILRTNLFGWNIQNKFSLAEWVIHELSAGKRIQGFQDTYFSSIYTFELARIIDQAIEKDLKGIYNCGSSTFMSKNEFARRIADYFQLNKSCIQAISIDQAHLKAPRRKNLGLDVRKMEAALGRAFPTLEESIEKFYDDYQKGIPGIIKQNNFRKIFPVLDHIPYGRQSIMQEDIQAVVDVLKSNYLTQGPKIPEFENGLRDITTARHCVAVNSATSALHIACLAADIGPGDEVITTPITFVASANCIVYCGGKPVFADIDARTYNISTQEIEKKITERTKAVIPVHFAGQSCDMDAIRDMIRVKERAYGHRIYLIEDACHALGSFYKNTRVGSCAYSDMTTLSFHPVKHITTGEGGAVLTNDKGVWRKLCYLRSHGITSDPEEFVHKDTAFEPAQEKGEVPVKRPWYYEQTYLGFNYRITDMQCALGSSQLKKLDQFRQRRREIVNAYNEAFARTDGLTIPYEADAGDSNFHLYVLLFDFENMELNRTQLMLKLREYGVYSQVHYIPVYTQPFYQKTFATRWGDCPEAEHYYHRCLSLPLYSSMTDDDVGQVITAIRKLARMRSRV